MDTRPDPARGAILDAARRMLAADPSTSVAAIAAAAGVSRATFYRHVGSRAQLLATLDIEPDPGARERILAAAGQLIARDGLARMSMDELAEVAGVSRASVYRLFPGKSAVFGALLATTSPFDEMASTLHRLRDRPPDEVLPEALRTAARIVEPRVAVVRALMFEVTAGTPEAVEAYRWVVRPLFGELSTYLSGQVAAGRIRPIHPVLAAQALIGPLIMFLVGRPLAPVVAGTDIDTADAVGAFATVSLHGLLP